MKKVSVVLIILGILIILIPLLGNLYISNKQTTLYNQYLNDINNKTHNTNVADSSIQQYSSFQNNKQIDNNDNTIEKNNTSNISINNDNVDNNSKNNMDWLKVIGNLKIDKINANLLFLKGSSQIELLYGAGHMPNTAFPGQTGNCCIAAHRGYYFGTYLYRVNELINNDIITVTHMGKSYTYSVYKKFFVSPEDIYILNQPDDKKILTIITCDPPIIGTRRLIIQANLIEK